MSASHSLSISLVLALRRLDHQGAADRKRHGRCMESKVHESLGHVLLSDLRGVLEAPEVHQQLVGDLSLVSHIDDIEVFLQSPAHVVRIENGMFGALSDSDSAECLDIGPGDG